MQEVEYNLSPFKKGISVKYLQDYFNDKERALELKLAYIHIKNGKINCDCLNSDRLSRERLFRFLALLKGLISSKEAPSSFEMIFSLHDSLSIDEPVFTVAKKRYSQTILCPDFFVLSGYQPYLGAVYKGNQSFPWKNKLKKGIWRGQTTGALYSYPSCLKLPRVKLVDLSMQYPDLLDAAFTGLVQFDKKDDERLFLKSYPLKSIIPVQEQIACKYLIDIDGNTCNDSRMYWMLHANSVLLKQSSAHIFWFTDRFKPYKHYLPFKNDLSDFMDQLKWAMENDQEVEEMALSSSMLARKIYHLDTQRKYLSSLLTQYKNLLY